MREGQRIQGKNFIFNEYKNFPHFNYTYKRSVSSYQIRGVKRACTKPLKIIKMMKLIYAASRALTYAFTYETRLHKHSIILKASVLCKGIG